MNIEEVVQDLTRPVVTTPVSTKDPTIELKKIQTQMKQHALKEKKKCAPSLFNFSNDTTFDTHAMDDLVDKEVARMRSKKGWKGLPKSVQWELLNAHFDTDAFKAIMPPDDASTFRKNAKEALVSNNGRLAVNYDSKVQRILSVTI